MSRLDISLRLPSLATPVLRGIREGYRAGARHFIFNRTELLLTSPGPLWNEFQAHRMKEFPGYTLYRAVANDARFLLNLRTHRFFAYDSAMQQMRQGRTFLFRGITK